MSSTSRADGTSSRSASKAPQQLTVAARAAERALATTYLASDPKFKKYTLQVDKCLTTFDNVHEWADFISFLTKLLKTFQSFMQFKEIPRKLIVSKRLAQCLNPALPSGVHQRALDVYSHVLAVLGPEGLKRDLQLWSTGLFPFFEYAATSVKPTLLNIYDTHYLPLQSDLRPVMKAFILALLPGMEEETGEFFDKVLSLLDRLSNTVSSTFFLQNVWLVLLTTPSARGMALNYLSRRMPHLGTTEDITLVVGRDLGLMIRAFAASLEDEQLLVRRGILDLLVQSVRIDGSAFKSAQKEDQGLLVKAALGVVLRRDLSLNRRLYTWLLGPSEGEKDQVIYFQANGLEVVRSTLRDEMFEEKGLSSSRPFKIFISLLDKWEIGGPVTEVLILDSLKAVKRNIANGDADDILMTASTLYEAVEPHAIWKQLFISVRAELLAENSSGEAIEMVQFVLGTFRVHEEEVQRVHLPLFLAGLLELLNKDVIRKRDTQDSRLPRASTTVQRALKMFADVLQHIPSSAVTRIPTAGSSSTAPAEVPSMLESPYSRAMSFYNLEKDITFPQRKPAESSSFITSFENLVSFCAVFSSPAAESNLDMECLLNTLALMFKLVKKIEKVEVKVSWDPDAWLDGLLSSFKLTAPFMLIDQVINLCVTLHQSSTRITPTVMFNKRDTLTIMINAVLRYLDLDHTPYHVRAVQLIWALEGATTYRHVESIIAQNLTSKDRTKAHQAFEVFGVLWRLTDDSLQPGHSLKIPMLIILDSLKSENPNSRRLGEAWMRSSLKSYIRVLDPLLADLLDPAIRRIPATEMYQGREVRGYVYEKPFDQNQIYHILESLLSVIRFGGAGFSKVATGTVLSNSKKGLLITRAAEATILQPSTTYMDVLIDILLSFLQTDPKPMSAAIMSPGNVRIQATSIELLQTIVSRGELDAPVLETIEAALIGRLYASVHSDRLELQNRLLHVLHSTIFASSTVVSTVETASKGKSMRESDVEPEDSATLVGATGDASTLSINNLNPLLVQTLLDGISKPSNRPALQHWMDFILMTVPQFQKSLAQLVFPLSDCICRQLRLGLIDMRRVSKESQKGQWRITSTVTDAELVTFLNALERLVLLSVTKSEARSVETDGTDAAGPSEKNVGAESSGLLGYVSNVFTADTSSATPNDEYLSPRSPGYRCLHEAVRVLHAIWTEPAWGASNSGASTTADSLSLIYTRTRTRCRKALEHLFRAQSAEVMESIIECWYRSSEPSADGSFEIVDTLASSAKTVVHMLCESISFRIVVTSERSKKLAANPNLSDAVLFAFLEEYFNKLEGPIAVQVWGRYLSLAKEVTSNVHGYKLQLFPTLKCVTVLAEKITQTAAAEDRKVRRELQETFTKLVDNCMLIAGRSFEQGNWILRGARDTLAVNGSNSPPPRVRSDSALNEKPLNQSVDDLSRSIGGIDLIDQIQEYTARKILPNLRRVLMESDKIATLCSNIVYYVVTPGMKSKSPKTLDVDGVVLDILAEMTKIPASAKAWRTSVLDAFNDNRFFNATPDSSGKWRVLIRSLMDTDKQTFNELINKVASAPSANIFTNREYEMMLRSLNLRRLSYVVYTGEKNQFLAQLPSIQEKLVEILRNTVVSPTVHSEVYLCIRVLLCRLSPQNMSSFWPTILTELFRVFEQATLTPPADGSDNLPLLLSACKTLDLLLVLQTEEFQIHEWMFITDTVDAVYRPENWMPEALLDQLAEIISDLPDTQTTPATSDPPLSIIERSSLRKPHLSNIRRLASIKELLPFFSQISLSSYESVYGLGGVDMEAVENGLLRDLFDGEDSLS